MQQQAASREQQACKLTCFRGQRRRRAADGPVQQQQGNVILEGGGVVACRWRLIGGWWCASRGSSSLTVGANARCLGGSGACLHPAFCCLLSQIPPPASSTPNLPVPPSPCSPACTQVRIARRSSM